MQLCAESVTRALSVVCFNIFPRITLKQYLDYDRYIHLSRRPLTGPGLDAQVKQKCYCMFCFVAFSLLWFKNISFAMLLKLDYLTYSKRCDHIEEFRDTDKTYFHNINTSSH